LFTQPSGGKEGRGVRDVTGGRGMTGVGVTRSASLTGRLLRLAAEGALPLYLRISLTQTR